MKAKQRIAELAENIPCDTPVVQNCVYIKAHDWGVQNEQVPADYKMDIVTGDLCGFVVWEDDAKIVITQQVFMDGGMRNLLAIPKACIIERLDLAVKL